MSFTSSVISYDKKSFRLQMRNVINEVTALDIASIPALIALLDGRKPSALRFRVTNRSASGFSTRFFYSNNPDDYDDFPLAASNQGEEDSSSGWVALRRPFPVAVDFYSNTDQNVKFAGLFIAGQVEVIIEGICA